MGVGPDGVEPDRLWALDLELEIDVRRTDSGEVERRNEGLLIYERHVADWIGHDASALRAKDPHVAPMAVIGGRLVLRPAVRHETQTHRLPAPSRQRHRMVHPLVGLLGVLENRLQLTRLPVDPSGHEDAKHHPVTALGTQGAHGRVEVEPAVLAHGHVPLPEGVARAVLVRRMDEVAGVGLAADGQARRPAKACARVPVDLGLLAAAQAHARRRQLRAGELPVGSGDADPGQPGDLAGIAAQPVAASRDRHEEIGAVARHSAQPKLEPPLAPLRRRHLDPAPRRRHADALTNDAARKCDAGERIGPLRREPDGGAEGPAEPAHALRCALVQLVPDAEELVPLLGRREAVADGRAGEHRGREDEAVDVPRHVGPLRLPGRVAAGDELVVDVVEDGASRPRVPEEVAVEAARPVSGLPVAQGRPALALDAVENAEGTLAADAHPVGLEDQPLPHQTP